MLTPITTTETGTVASVEKVSNFDWHTAEESVSYTTQITPDNGRATLTVVTSTSPEVGVGDKVSYTVSRSNLGTVVTDVTKIA